MLAGRELARVNAFVDAYNAVSLAHVLPLGADDLDRVMPPLAFRFASAGDSFLDMAGEAEGEPPEVPKPGEVVYADARHVLCRRWNWRQGRRTRLTEKSRNAYFILEVLCPPFAEGDFENAVQEIAGGLAAFGAAQVITERLR